MSKFPINFSSTSTLERIEYLRSLSLGSNLKARIIKLLIYILYKHAKILVACESKYKKILKKRSSTSLNSDDISPEDSLGTPALSNKNGLSSLNKSEDSLKYPWLNQQSNQICAKGKRILIIAELSIRQCTKYRVEQKIQMFKELGCDTQAVSWTDSVECRNALQSCSVVIFYRTPDIDSVRQIFNEAKRLGLTTIFDIDDLVFDVEEYSKNSNLLKLDVQDQENLLEGARLYRNMLKLCDHAIASTEKIAEFMKKYCEGRIFVVENCLDKGILDLSESISSLPIHNPLGVVSIGYGSGTTTHDADFELVSEAMLEIMKSHGNVRLLIHGYLKLPDEFESFSNRIVHIPFLEEHDYYRSISGFDINLAPLEKSLFNDAKSNIKYIEASVFQVPTVASSRETFRQVIKDGENGFLAETTEDWFQALDQLVKSETLRKEIGKKARETVMSQYHFQQIAKTQVAPILELIFQEKSPVPKKRILIVNVLFPPTSFGGATIVAEQMALELNKRDDLEVVVFTGISHCEGMDLPEYHLIRYEYQKIPVIAVKFPNEFSSEIEYNNPIMREVFDNVLSALHPDVVHFHSIQQLSATITEACVERKIPYAITLHDCWWICQRQFMIMKDETYCEQEPVDIRICSDKCVGDAASLFKRDRYLRDILNKAKILLTPSEFQRNLYISNGIIPERIAVNKNGVMTPCAVNEKETDNNCVRFAYLGGKAVHKGYFLLKEAFESIDMDNYELHITDIHRKLGSVHISENEWKKIKGSAHINAGFNQDNIDAFFKNIDVLIFPSQCKESFGLTIREALTRGVWVIATDSGGSAEDIEEGVNGNVIPMNSTEAIREAILALLKNPNAYKVVEVPGIRHFPKQANELSEFLLTDKVL